MAEAQPDSQNLRDAVVSLDKLREQVDGQEQQVLQYAIEIVNERIHELEK